MDGIDYEALFKQVRAENEGLRLFIVKIKNATPSTVEKVLDWLQDDEVNRVIIALTLAFILVSLVIPGLKQLCLLTYRRFYHEG